MKLAYCINLGKTHLTVTGISVLFWAELIFEGSLDYGSACLGLLEFGFVLKVITWGNRGVAAMYLRKVWMHNIIIKITTRMPPSLPLGKITENA